MAWLMRKTQNLIEKKWLYVIIIHLNKYVLNTDHIPDTELDTRNIMVSNTGTISSLMHIK